MSVGLAIAALLLPLMLGAIADRLGLFRERAAAMAGLNRYALHLAFPALVTAAAADPATPLESAPMVAGIVILSIGLATPLAGLLGTTRALHGQGGTLALVASFGNVAYLGLPLVSATLGPAGLAIASVAVPVHVGCAMTLGLIALQRFGPTEGGKPPSLTALLRVPLLWSPWVGIAMRLALPAEALDAGRALLAPLAASASPVALTVLGAYLHANWHVVREGLVAALAHAAMRLALVPALTLAAVVMAHRLGALDSLEAQVLVVLSTMPAGITTFVIAHEAGARSDRVAGGIVLSTLLSMLAIPAWLALSVLMTR